MDTTNYDNMTMEFDVLHGKLQFTPEGIAHMFTMGVQTLSGCYDSNCIRFKIEFRPLMFDSDMHGNFSICNLTYIPDQDFNTAPGMGFLEERLRISLGQP